MDYEGEKKDDNWTSDLTVLRSETREGNLY